MTIHTFSSREFTRDVSAAMIAATALAHKFTVVTRNVANFAHLGVNLVNPRQG